MLENLRVARHVVARPALDEIRFARLLEKDECRAVVGGGRVARDVPADFRMPSMLSLVSGSASAMAPVRER